MKILLRFCCVAQRDVCFIIAAKSSFDVLCERLDQYEAHMLVILAL